MNRARQNENSAIQNQIYSFKQRKKLSVSFWYSGISVFNCYISHRISNYLCKWKITFTGDIKTIESIVIRKLLLSTRFVTFIKDGNLMLEAMPWKRLGFPKRRGNQFNQQQSAACWIVASTVPSVICPYLINLYVSYDSNHMFNLIYVIISASVGRYHCLKWIFTDNISHIRPKK